MIIEKEQNRKFGGTDGEFPLLLAVRCSSTVLYPELINSVLSVGMNWKLCQQLAVLTNNYWFALNTYATFMFQYGQNVMNRSSDVFLKIARKYSENPLTATEFNLPVESLEKIIAEFSQIVPMPNDPYDQLKALLKNIYRQWGEKRYYY